MRWGLSFFYSSHSPSTGETIAAVPAPKHSIMRPFCFFKGLWVVIVCFESAAGGGGGDSGGNGGGVVVTVVGGGGMVGFVVGGARHQPP